MDDCGGCAKFQRRVEIYTNTDRGCGDEFGIPAPEPEPKPTPAPTTNPVEPTGAAYLATISLATVAISLY